MLDAVDFNEISKTTHSIFQQFTSYFPENFFFKKKQNKIAQRRRVGNQTKPNKRVLIKAHAKGDDRKYFIT